MTTTDYLPGDFGLTQISGQVGKLIRFGEFLDGTGFSNYEHVFVYIGGGQIVEAEPGGARISSVTEYGNVLWSTGHFDLSTVQRSTITAAARGFVGVPYSFLDYQAIAAHRLHIPVPWLKDYIKSTKHMICSQLADACYQEAGYQLFDDERWNGYVTPGDLYDLLTSTP